MAHGRPVILLLLIALAVLFAPVAAPAGEARVVQLKHRSASEVIPLIRPLLAPDDVLTGMDYRLIVRTSDKNFQEIERVLAQVDVARRRLRITVEQGVSGDSAATSQSVTGEARVGDHARVTLPGKPAEPGAIVVQKDGLRYTAGRRTVTTRGAETQTLLTQDGQRAYIRIGQSVPHVQRILALGRHRFVAVQGVEYQDVTTGFDVLPRVRGDRVLVEITPRLATLRDPATGLADFQELTTTVETRLGEWLDLGEILGNRGEVERTILESGSSESGERRTVRIRIE